MSAFCLGSREINLIVNAVPAREIKYLNYPKNYTPAELGQLLVDENVRSVCYRYKDLTPDTAFSNFTGEEGYQYRPSAGFGDAWINYLTSLNLEGVI